MTETLTIEKFEEAKELEDKDKKALAGSKKPPKDGPCKRCGKDRPLNRLMLCMPCWVKVRLEERGWREGQPHPGWCGCSGECSVESKGGTN